LPGFAIFFELCRFRHNWYFSLHGYTSSSLVKTSFNCAVPIGFATRENAQLHVLVQRNDQKKSVTTTDDPPAVAAEKQRRLLEMTPAKNAPVSA
jgi:hypothetical protein